MCSWAPIAEITNFAFAVRLSVSIEFIETEKFGHQRWFKTGFASAVLLLPFTWIKGAVKVAGWNCDPP
uniref:Uncharacterized protein n=1 Tax=Trichuris muris TaxID=70415 RepID=A0A5S6QSU0_TRIMR